MVGKNHGLTDVPAKSYRRGVVHKQADVERQIVIIGAKIASLEAQIASAKSIPQICDMTADQAAIAHDVVSELLGGMPVRMSTGIRHTLCRAKIEMAEQFELQIRREEARRAFLDSPKQLDIVSIEDAMAELEEQK